jgi:adenylosuccinate synthase
MIKYLMWGEIILQVNQLSKEQRELLKLEFEYFHDNEWIETYARYVYAHHHFIQIVDNSFFEERLQQKGTIVFEGAQGVLLDEDWGFHPYTTWSHTTTKNIKKILDYHRFDGLVHNYGLIRAYHTRHGAGPFPTESPMSGQFYEDHNVTNSWQSNFRVGPLDLDLIIYAQLANYNAADADPRFDIHSLVISCFDKFFGQKSIPVSFPYTESFDEEFTLDRNDFTKREIITKFYQKSKPDFFDLIFSDDPISTKDILPFVEQMKIETGLTVSVVSVSPTWEGRINIQELIEKRGEVNTMGMTEDEMMARDAMAAATATAEADQAAATQAEAGVAEGVSNTAPEAE